MTSLEHCVKIIKLYDRKLYLHCCRTATLAQLLGNELHQDGKLLYNAGMVHDIGKLATSNKILMAPRKLTKEERSLIDLHSYLGYCILDNFHIDKDICQIVLFHHGFDKPLGDFSEKVDEKILMMANTLRCADAFEALTADRVYSKKINGDMAIEIMRETSDFDKKTINMLDRVYQSKRYEAVKRDELLS